MNTGLLKYSFFFFVMILFSMASLARQTEIQYLSGKECDQPVKWNFFCTSGMNSGKWTTIPVPSNWELQGFGKYNYGLDKDTLRGKEKGLYKYRFSVPAGWSRKEVNIVFDGSMTDTEVRINGKLAGEIHQGAFYQFKYDISKLLKYGGTNLLEVTVSKHSSNVSVNKAERSADFWIFGGIYRPVYLEAKPVENIVRTAIDARADGSAEADIYLSKNKSADKISAQVYTLQGEKIGSAFQSTVTKNSDKIHLTGKVQGVKSWNPEFPNLYRITFSLSSKGTIIHETTEKIGFRTVEIRERDGIYVNGVKIKFRGICHHTFWPTTGRASSRQMSIDDVNLIKEMNMNAVRTSHYPPDSHFLEACDSLGLFVLDELTGWHNQYETTTGTRLVKEMVVRDVNHPSVVIWDNGNEGGHNTDLDPLFAEYDIQKRVVIHPWKKFNGTDTQHYINYDYGAGTYWHGHEIVFPTEFLHGLYDGGLGAGLYDFWELMWNNPRASGGFLWVFADEGVVRTDRNNEIDTDGSHAPDGILGPFHEKEGSFYAVKEIWSPVRFEAKDITPAFDGTLNIENRYFYTNLAACKFKWKLAAMPDPEGRSARMEISGEAVAPDVLPGHKGEIRLRLPDSWRSYDVLYLTVSDPHNKELFTWSWPIKLPATMAEKNLGKSGNKPAIKNESDSTVTIAAGAIQVTLSKKSGLLQKVVNKNGEIPFNNGPALCAGETKFKSMTIASEGDTIKAVCTFEKESKMKEVIWNILPTGRIRLDIRYNPIDYESDFMGVSFSYPEKEMRGVKWLGQGPYRVWKNRLQGGTLDVHEKSYNNTMTGIPPLIYPEFKGYHAQLYWARLLTTGQSFTVGTASEDVFLRLFTPESPAVAYNTAPPFPSGDISFMQAIPAIGTKSQKAENLGPSGKKNLYFDYGPYDKWQTRSKKLVLYFDFSAQSSN